MEPSKPTLLFVVTEDWYFWSHRIGLARFLVKNGWDVHVATRIQNHLSLIESEGITVHELSWKRGSFNILNELNSLRQIAATVNKVKPSLVHLVALKPILYGNFAAMFTRKVVVVNAVAGLGASFVGESTKATWLRRGVEFCFSWFLKGNRKFMIVQNEDDADFFRSKGYVPAGRISLIPGSGIDTDKFGASPEPTNPPIVVTLVGRMLRTKGVREAVDAVRALSESGLEIRLTLVGAPDPENIDSVPDATLEEWNTYPFVHWTGPQSDIPSVWRQSHIALLPSYREGLPLSLIEAASCGRPLVAFDVPGCREIVRNGKNGFLVPEKDVGALTDSLKRLATDGELRTRLGQQARRDAETIYSDDVVHTQTKEFYHRILNSGTATEPSERSAGKDTNKAPHTNQKMR